jgi:magnesium-transporting ATPase (P-type)
MFRLLAVCHTVVVDYDQLKKKLTYQASSPDELALIQGATQAGFILKEKSPSEMVIFNENIGATETYKILAEFPFDSTRKRMSLIVQIHD